MRTNVWIGGAFLFVAGLTALAYLSPSFDSFLEENRVYTTAFLTILFVALGLHFYSNDQLQFALIGGFFSVVMGILLAIEIWHERTFGRA